VHLPPQTCTSSITILLYRLLFLITILYLIYLILLNLHTPLTPSSLHASLTSQGTGIPHAGLGLGRSTGPLFSSNAPPLIISSTPYPSLQRRACSRSGTRTTNHVSLIHHTHPSPNPPIRITSTHSSKAYSNPTRAAFNVPHSRSSRAIPFKGTTPFATAPPPPIIPHVLTAATSLTSGTSFTDAITSPYQGRASSFVATFPYPPHSRTHMEDAASASSSKPLMPSSDHSHLGLTSPGTLRKCPSSPTL
jgi:hypothetical protein